ncbi:hypothetical protein [Paenibacillus alkalitolerans]|uniref:hypothetical protein n=1 Tax=Paenibacillus alkalitolerans TaxID=2799335 RepID=UPI0018F66D76|nr:hypothetical protein [Paenibacillus alkalitolerans]
MKNIAWIITLIMLMIALSGCLGNTGNEGGTGNAEQAQSGDEKQATGNELPAANNDEQQTDGQTSDNPDETVSSGKGDGGEDGSTGAADSDNAAKNRPETKTDTIELEGMPEKLEFTLHDNPALQFSTYISNDLLVEGAGSGQDGDSLTVIANFAGKKNEDAKVQFFSPSKGTRTTVEEQTEEAKQSLQSEGYEISERTGDSPNSFAMSDIEFFITKQNEDGHHLLGIVSIFKHGDRVYRVTVQYNEDWEEGFVPRVNKMFEDIVWYETP